MMQRELGRSRECKSGNGGRSKINILGQTTKGSGNDKQEIIDYYP
jgi:hypothetical protein